MAKTKLAVPDNVLTQHQVGVVQTNLGGGLLAAVKKNFPSWCGRNHIFAGEIILQTADYTVPIDGMYPGLHLTVSLISFSPDRDYVGLARDLVTLIKAAEFMLGINVFVQMSLDTLVVKDVDDVHYRADPSGKFLLEFGSKEKPDGWEFVELQREGLD